MQRRHASHRKLEHGDIVNMDLSAVVRRYHANLARSFSISEPDDTLEPGFVANHEFNFYLPGGKGIRELIDTFEVTDSEIRWMHGFPKDLVVID